jgi:hypothetical protein
MNKNLQPNKNIFVVVMLICVLLPLPVSAGKIYKWMDADGNVQFSNTPGPNQGADAHIGDTQVKKSYSHSRKKSMGSMLSGLWYGTLRGNSYRLRLGKNFINWGRAGESVNSSFPIFEAKWEDVEGDLKITYTRHWQNEAMNGKTDTIRVISKSNDKLTLQFPDKRVYNLSKMVSRKKVGYEGKSIIGTWIRKHDGAETRFTSGRFDTKNKVANYTGPVTIEHGNWTIGDGVLTFTYMGGIKASGRQGAEKKFNVLLSDERQLILEDSKTQKQIVYSRKLLK